ncbi:MAG: TetR family transcriptional regulator, partial [Roseibium sp.]
MKRAQPYDREKALDAAQDLFWRKGYHATSLKDLEAALT